MISAIVKYILSIVGGLLGWYFLQDAANDFIDRMVVRYPTVYPPALVTYARSMIHFVLLFALIALSYGVIVTAFRTRPEGYYR